MSLSVLYAFSCLITRIRDAHIATLIKNIVIICCYLKKNLYVYIGNNHSEHLCTSASTNHPSGLRFEKNMQ